MSGITVGGLDAFVEAFENALGRDGEADLTDFLPAPSDPLRRAVLLELVRVDLEWGWSHDRPTALDNYRQRFPELFSDLTALHAVTFEEFRLRRQAGQTPTAEEYEQNYGIDVSRWPRPTIPDDGLLEQAAMAYREFSRLAPTNRRDVEVWCQSFRGDPTAARVFRDLHTTNPDSAQRMAEAVLALPEAGETLLDFHLEQELGRGAFGRVFLARQAGLAGRLVALKVTPDVGGESQTLAQLQHTHIVPIYSVHRTGPLLAICMPYFGRTTLADVLRNLAARPARPLSGAELLSSVGRRADSTLTDAEGTIAPAAPDLANVTLRKLEGRSYPEAVLWLGACLADGLAHAHDRGILHRDLKPANVLLTDEGLPMLLDFNLSEDVKLRGTPAAAVVGGTLPYMAPEQLEAFAGSDRNLDGRTDVFALGILLYELLASRSPFPRAGKGVPMPAHELVREMLKLRSQPPTPVRHWNRAVSPAVEAILARCLHPDPGQRYATARQLHEDLERQLEHRPLLHIPEPSFRERVQKWVRSNPRTLGRVAILTACVILIGALGAGVWGWRQAQTGEALTLVQAFRHDWHTVHDLVTVHTDAPEQTERALEIGHKALERLHVLKDPGWLDHSAVHWLPAEERGRVKREVGELLLMMARATADHQLIQTQGAVRQEGLEAGLELNHRAEQCFPPHAVPAALWLQRAELLRRNKQAAAAAEALERARNLDLAGAEDHFLLAREHIGMGRHRDAAPLLQEAVRLDPQHFWAHFLLGACYYEMGDDLRAATRYSVCIALAPRRHEPYFNRGLAAYRQRDYTQARADFTEVLRLQPNHPDALINRGLALQGLREYRAAGEDFTAALEHGVQATRVYFLRAKVRELAGDREGARSDRAEGLSREPGDEKSWVARGVARMRSDPAGALADFDRALALKPRSRAALMGKADVLAEQLKQTEASIAVLDCVTELFPDHAPAYSGRGVLHARLGHRDAALRDAEAALTRFPSPLVRYQVGCIHALSARTADEKSAAMKFLTDAVRLGFGGNLLKIDADLDPLRPLPEFQRLEQLVALQGTLSTR